MKYSHYGSFVAFLAKKATFQIIFGKIVWIQQPKNLETRTKVEFSFESQHSVLKPNSHNRLKKYEKTNVLKQIFPHIGKI